MSKKDRKDKNGKVEVLLTLEEAQLLRELLRHRYLELSTQAAYVAYSSAYNGSEARKAERQHQEEGAIEAAKLQHKFEKAIGPTQ